MKVRIVNRPTGLLNGRDWPEAGEVLEVSDEVGADMCSSGIGEPVTDVDGDVETAVVAEDAEQAVPAADAVEEAVPPEPEKRARKSAQSPKES